MSDDPEKSPQDRDAAKLGFGLALGAGLGVVFHNIALGVSLGLLLGFAMSAAGRTHK